MSPLVWKKMGELHELGKVKCVSMDMLSHELFLSNPEVQMTILCLLATTKSITFLEAVELMISCVRLHSITIKIKNYGEDIAKSILTLQKLLETAPATKEIKEMKDDIDKLLHSHEESVTMKLDEFAKLASVSLS